MYTLGLEKAEQPEETIHQLNMKSGRNTQHYGIENADTIGIAIAQKPTELGLLLPGSECCPDLFIILLPHPQS